MRGRGASSTPSRGRLEERPREPPGPRSPACSPAARHTARARRVASRRAPRATRWVWPRGPIYARAVRVLAVGNMYPPHSFGGYELMWRSAMLHLERHGHRARVLTTDVDTGTSAPDDANVRRALRWYLRDNHYPRLPGLERV